MTGVTSMMNDLAWAGVDQALAKAVKDWLSKPAKTRNEDENADLYRIIVVARSAKGIQV